MSTGTILLFSKRKNTINSFFIKLFQRVDGKEASRWHHAGMEYVKDGVVYVAEARANGVKINRKLDWYFDHGYDILRLEYKKAPTEYTEHELEFIFENIIKSCKNRKYDYYNLLVFQVYKYISKFFGKTRYINQTHDEASEKFICGEFVAYVHNLVNGTFPWWDSIAPSEIYNDKVFNHKTVTDER